MIFYDVMLLSCIAISVALNFYGIRMTNRNRRKGWTVVVVSLMIAAVVNAVSTARMIHEGRWAVALFCAFAGAYVTWVAIDLLDKHVIRD